MNTTSKTLTALAGLAIVSASANGATLFDDPLNELADPTITDSQTPHTASYSADNVFDDVVTGSEVDTVYATGLPTNAAADAFIDFDFGAATNIGGFVFYQRKSNNDQVSDFDLIFSNNADFSSPVATVEFISDGSGDFLLVEDPTAGDAIRQEFEFTSGINARYVKWQVNASDSIFDGATEMEFWGVPEPSSLALLGMGGLCVLRRRRG